MRYQIRHAIVKYAADTILEDVNFEIHDHEKIAIIGRNGCGKTTLLKLISGEVEMANPDSDEECGIVMAGKQRIGYLRQISFEDSSITVEEEILKVFAPVFSCEKRMQELTEQMKTDTSEHLLKEYAGEDGGTAGIHLQTGYGDNVPTVRVCVKRPAKTDWNFFRWSADKSGVRKTAFEPAGYHAFG